MGSPTVKATHAQVGLRAHDVFSADIAAAITTRAENAIAGIKSGRGALPVELELAVLEAIFAVAGAEGVRTRVTRQITLSADGPLLRTIRDGAARLFGLTPGSLLRFADAGWRSSFGGCGALRFEAGPERDGLLVYSAAPAVLANSPAWRERLAGAFMAVCALCGTVGEVDVRATNDGAVYRCRWR